MNTANRCSISFFFLFFLLRICLPTCISGQPYFSQINSYKMVINPAYTGIIDSILQKDTSKEITFLYKNKPNFQSYKYIMGTLQIPLTKINSGVGIMVNYNTLKYYMPIIQIGPYGFINLAQVNAYYNELAAKLFYSYNFNSNFSAGIDIGQVNYNFFLYAPGETYTTHPSATYGDVGILYKKGNWIFGVSFGSNITPSSQYPFALSDEAIPNYPSFAYNILIEYTTTFKNAQLNIVGSYYSNLLGLQGIACFQHILILGTSITSLYGTHYLESMPYSHNATLYAAPMVGINLLHDKLKITVSYDFFHKASSYDTGPFSNYKQNIETIVNDRFN